MAVSLFDLMRPIAIAGGIGAGYQSATPLGQPSALLSAAFGLLVGIAAFVASQRLATHLLHSRGAMAQRINSSEAALGVLYSVVFVLLVALPFLGADFARRLLAHV